MRKLTGVFLLILSISFCSAQSHKGFRWIGKSHILYKIDMETGNLFQELPNQKALNLGPINAWDSLKKEFPGDFDVVPHYYGDSLIITVPGTGNVYHLDINALTCSRLDKTFFRGYNFNAYQFVRNDTIFSIGGEGFWQKHSLITFYDSKNKEWSIYKTQNLNSLSTLDLFSGYSPKHDAFFSVNVRSSFFPDTIDNYLSIFRFDKSAWETKGILVPELKECLKANFKSVWTGECLILYNLDHQEKVIILDPFNNLFYRYESPNDHFFLDIAELYAQNGFLYSREITSSGNSDKKGLDSVSISSMMSVAQKQGKVFMTPTPVIYYILPILILIALLGLFLWKRKEKKIANSLALSELELLSLQEFMANPRKKFTTLEVNTLLKIEKKTYDNQRQIRNRIISNINQQFLSILENKEFICRAPNEEDKRMMEYYVNPELRQKELDKVKESLGVSH